jgi:hypothetical protein
MVTRPAFILLCFLAPLVAGADPLDVYGQLTGKTVLMPSALPRLADSITADLPADKPNAIARMEKALAEQGLEVVQDGPHFVRIFRKEARESLTNAPLRGAELAGSKGQETLAPGMIFFGGADLNQVLDLYAELAQRTVLRPITLPAPPINLKTQSALTRQEVVYALATVLALNGICLVDDGAKFVQAVPMVQRDQVKTRAPKPEPGAKLFDPKKVPSMGVSDGPRPASPPSRPLTEVERIEQEFERLRTAFYNFVHSTDSSKPACRRLFELYARLARKTPAPSKDFDGRPIWFHVEMPLTRNELLYAIETTFELNGLVIIPVDDQKIRLGRMSEVLRNVGGRLERIPPKQ